MVRDERFKDTILLRIRRSSPLSLRYVSKAMFPFSLPMNYEQGLQNEKQPTQEEGRVVGKGLPRNPRTSELNTSGRSQ